MTAMPAWNWFCSAGSLSPTRASLAPVSCHSCCFLLFGPPVAAALCVSSSKCSLALLESQFHFNQGENAVATNKNPSTTLQHGAIKAAIWLNDGSKGPFCSTTFPRTFKDQGGA